MSDIRKPLLPQREGSSHSTPGARRHLHDAYAIEDRIGGGADGRVCRGIARKGPYEGEAHAIKRFREKAYDPELEMRVLAAVQPHPHILQLLDVYRDGLGVAFAAPESDMNLREFMARRPLGLAATQAWEFNRQILSGIQHLHKKRVVHRDLKPANILLRMELHGLNLLVADFSRAREMQSLPVPQRQQDVPAFVDSGREAHARALMTAGVATPHYEAPECGFCHDRCVASISMDLWSFGVVAFELRAPEVFMLGEGEASMWQCAAARIGPPPRGLVLGPKQACIFAARLQHRVSAQSVSEIGLWWGGAYLDLVKGTAKWVPELRLTATDALKLVETRGIGLPIQAPAASLPQRMVPTPNEGSVIATTHDAPPGPVLSEAVATTAPEACRRLRATPSVEEIVDRPERIKRWMINCRATVIAAHPRQDSTPTVKRKSGAECQCSGHCNQPRHSRHKCQRKDLVVGATRCPACTCVVAGCLCPRIKSDFCFYHAKHLLPEPVVLQCIRATGDWWPDLIPCDILAFIEQWPLIRVHPLLALISALLKEPTAMAAWQETDIFSFDAATLGSGSCPKLDWYCVLTSLKVMLYAVDQCPNAVEVEQLGRNGAARISGPRATLVQLGIIVPVDDDTPLAATRGETFALGKKGSIYRIHEDAEQSIKQLLKVSESEEVWEDWTKVQTSSCVADIARAATKVFTVIGSGTSTPMKSLPMSEKHSYTRLFVVRKILLARTSCRNAESESAPAWDLVSRDELREMCPDEREWLSRFPQEWSAADIGSLMLCSPAAGVFVSMFACLWADATRKSCHDADQERDFVQAVRGGRSQVERFWHENGIPPHPATMMNSLISSRGLATSSVAL